MNTRNNLKLFHILLYFKYLINFDTKHCELCSAITGY